MQIIRRIDVPVRDVKWSDSGELVAILSESSFYILSFDRGVVDATLASGAELEEDGIEDAFELLNEVSERVRTGVCLLYDQPLCLDLAVVDYTLRQKEEWSHRMVLKVH